MASNHRDNLRGDLIEAGQALLLERGYDSLSIRQLATHVGVSSGAPYHHFSDRRSLLIALALDGFHRLNLGAQAEIAGRPDGSPHVLAALANYFMDFCADNPALVDLMYESELTRPIDPALQPAYQDSFEMVVNAVQGILSEADRSVALVRAVAFWSTLFGYARIWRNQLLDPFHREQPGDWRSLIIDEAVEAVLRPVRGLSSVETGSAA